jgi:hypothetical protein
MPEGVADVSQIFLRDTHVLPKFIAVLLQPISGVSAINPLVAFYDIHGEKRVVLFFYLSRTPHDTITFLSLMLYPRRGSKDIPECYRLTDGKSFVSQNKRVLVAKVTSFAVWEQNYLNSFVQVQ